MSLLIQWMTLAGRKKAFQSIPAHSDKAVPGSEAASASNSSFFVYFMPMQATLLRAWKWTCVV
jgi:hypothetical protein